MLTTEVENFPGFPKGIMGPDLMQNMRKQAEHHGAQLLDVNFTTGDFGKSPFVLTTDDDKTYSAKSVILATGADTKWLGVPGEKEKIGRGVSSCAPCDAAFYRGKNVLVIGGGDSAMEEADVLTKFANHVWIIHRREEFRASDIMQKRIFENPKVTAVWNTEVLEIMGEMKVEKARLKTLGNVLKIKEANQDKSRTLDELGKSIVEKDDSSFTWDFPVEGIFVSIGHVPNTQVLKGIDLDEKGFVKVYDHTKTNNEGVYVAGDVHDTTYKQAVTAASFGCMAALDLEKWLRSK